MDKLSRLYAYHIDEIRRKKAISVADLCIDICDSRSYRRYLSGERTLSQDRIYEFCNKLGINPVEMFNTFMDQDISEYQQVLNAYKLLQSKDFVELKEVLKKLTKRQYDNPANRMFLETITIRYEQLSNQITSAMALEKLSDLIGYPDERTVKIFTFVDLIALIYIADMETRKGEFRSNEFFQSILSEEDNVYLSNDQKYILSSIYSVFAFNLGRQGNFELCLDIASRGIDYANKRNTTDHLAELYYAKALANMKLGFPPKALDAASKCLASLFAQEDYSKLKYYYELLKKDFKTEPLHYIHEQFKQYIR